MPEKEENKKGNKKLPPDNGPGTENRKPKFNVTWIYVLAFQSGFRNTENHHEGF